ncbi:lysophospholipid acyltransferase family protein [Mangrovicella endophytica]|uniref:lysophospholipid acyltransferase family protein n=1 Tax=Mangrovicella endophytica TaxID=2066697 RepID=UPI000C9E821D|nr:lysophospholipid acyltransferase family protein [Mangrovicella endophytica]
MIDLVRYLLIAGIRLLIGARAEWAGARPVERQRIYFANHASHFDTLAVLACLPPALRRRTHPVAARDYWARTRFHRFIAEDCLRSVLIDRRRESAEDPLGPVLAALASGDSVLIFPEGTRGQGDAIGSFKSGLFHLARQVPKAELVPVHLDNLARIMPKGSFLVVPITCTARFGAPLERIADEPKEAFLARARQAVVDLDTRRVAR